MKSDEENKAASVLSLTASVILLAFMLSSCVRASKVNPDGTKETYSSLGGKGLYKSHDTGGFTVMHNHEKSFRDGAIAIGAIATSGFTYAAESAKEATARVGLKEASRQNIAAGKEFTKQTAIGADVSKKAIESNQALEVVTPINGNSIPR